MTPTEEPSKAPIKQFARNERGSLIIFSLFLLVCQLLMVGIAIDVVRTEAMRTRLQNTVDAAVLAAADLDQTLSPTDVVTDYFERAGLAGVLDDVSIQQTVSSRIVTANASYDVPSLVLNMVGIDTLQAPATGTAVEGVTDVEVSLVLDISGSMDEGTKMADLRNAASMFVDMVVDDGEAAGVSLSIVPYTAQVNAGAAIMDQMNVSRVHGYSSCVDFEPADFTTTSVSLSQSYAQMQHFEYSSSTASPITNPGCPQAGFEEITAVSEDVAGMKAKIAQFTPRANTAIHLGMKWGVALLDPASKPMVTNLIAAGKSSATFGDRPYNWDRPDTLKIVVVMTDGLNVPTSRVKPVYYDTASERTLWHEHSLGRLADLSGIHWASLIDEKYSPAQADAMLLNVCQAARDKGIIVYSVGLEVTSHSKTLLETCSATPTHYFGVNSDALDDAFAAIARQINSLRLTN